MKRIAENFGIAICGLVTSILVAVADAALARMIGFDFFTFSFWFVVPVGAVLTGLAAASGYYFGSLFFHKRAGAAQLFQMVLIAGMTQVLIYWFEYKTLVLDNGLKVANFIPFAQYLDISLTKAHYMLGTRRGAHGAIGAAGKLGYWMASIQFVGFLAGGILIWFVLRAKPVCPACDLYLRPLAKRQKTFADPVSASAYYDKVFSHPVGSDEFASLMRMKAEVPRPMEGAFHVDTVLLACPECKGQTIEEKVKVFNGKQWNEFNHLNRQVSMPKGVNIARLFRR